MTRIPIAARTSKLTALASALLVISAPAQAANLSLSHITSNGKSTIHAIPKAAAMKLPRWDPEGGKPAPLPVDVAVKKGKEWMKSKNPKMDDFKVRSIALVRIGYSSLPDRWYYKLEFDPIIADQPLFGAQFVAVVLLDGTVVEPVVRDAENP